MGSILKLRYKGSYNTRSNQVDFLDTGVEDIYGSAGFVNLTAKLWNKSPINLQVNRHPRSSASGDKARGWRPWEVTSKHSASIS